MCFTASQEKIILTLITRVAGSDSTANAIRTTLLCLISTPSALAALRQEIDSGVTAGRISAPIRDSEARSLPYLQAVIKEGLRMYPPATGHNYKQVPKGGDTVYGYFLPEGTQLGVNIHCLLRCRETFGPDANVFRPERWMEAANDEDRLREMSNTVEFVFGYGKFQCMGKMIAAMELNKVLVEVSLAAVLSGEVDGYANGLEWQLLRRYDFAIVNPPTPLKLYDAAFWVANDFWLRVTRRPDGE
jgi:cytochrome P450